MISHASHESQSLSQQCTASDSLQSPIADPFQSVSYSVLMQLTNGALNMRMS